MAPETRGVINQLKLFRSMPLDLCVELGTGKLTLRDLLGLRYHSVFVLEQNAGAKLNIYVNGVLLGKGEPVVLENRVGIKIDEILEAQR